MNQKGFAHLILIIIVIGVLTVVVGGIWYSRQLSGQSKQQGQKRDDFGCWPDSCSSIPDAQGKKACEDWKAGKQIDWPPSCSSVGQPACQKLCESEKAANPQSSSGSSQQNYQQQTQTSINGKTLEARLAEANARLHTIGSGEHVRKSFPDIVLVYTDDGAGVPFPKEIIPFRHYYSAEADTTFSICKPGFTVFICKGKFDRLVRQEDLDSGRCNMTEEQKIDPRL